jgi:hypothetical protein
MIRNVRYATVSEIYCNILFNVREFDLFVAFQCTHMYGLQKGAEPIHAIKRTAATPPHTSEQHSD